MWNPKPMSPPRNSETPALYSVMYLSVRSVFPALLWENESLGLKGL